MGVIVRDSDISCFEFSGIERISDVIKIIFDFQQIRFLIWDRTINTIQCTGTLSNINFRRNCQFATNVTKERNIRIFCILNRNILGGNIRTFSSLEVSYSINTNYFRKQELLHILRNLQNHFFHKWLYQVHNKQRNNL